MARARRHFVHTCGTPPDYIVGLHRIAVLRGVAFLDIDHGSGMDPMNR